MKYINISKKDIAKLKSKGYSMVDTHIHTNASFDCKVSINSILKKAKEMGIGVGISDHDKIESAVAAFDNKLGVLVIPGIEVYAKNYRHVLFYFYEKKELIRFYNNEVKDKFLRKTVNELLNLKDKYKCIVGVAHPRGYLVWHYLRINYDIKKVDFLEALNYNCPKSKTLKSNEWASKYKKGTTAGSDAHKLRDVGKCLTCSKEKTVKCFLDSVKNRRTFVIGSVLPFKMLAKRFPRDMFHLGFFIASKIYHNTGIKSLVWKYKK